MHIEWNITKRRGNIRPVLHYTVTLEEHERELALPFIRVVSTIPEPPDSWQEFCYPGQHERAENPASGKTYDLEIPSHKGRLWKQSLRLPWRETSFDARRFIAPGILAERFLMLARNAKAS